MESFQIENSKFQIPIDFGTKFLYALVVELVDTQDLKSCGHCGRIGSIPIRGTKADYFLIVCFFQRPDNIN